MSPLPLISKATSLLLCPISLLPYLHVFIEQHHENEAEQDAGGHRASEERSEEFMGDDAL